MFQHVRQALQSAVAHKLGVVLTEEQKQLCKAVKRNNHTEVRQLLKSGMSPDFVDEGGCTNLGIAAESGNLNMVKCLLEMSYSERRTLLPQLAYKVVQSMTAEETCLFEAVHRGNVDEMKDILKKGNINLDRLNMGGVTCLGVAAEKGDMDIIKYLLKNHADVNKSDFFGQTALQHAAEFGHVELVKHLIASGANVNWMDVRGDGLSAVHIVACKGHVEVANLLIEAGSNVNAQNLNGISALHCAVPNGSHDIVEALITAGANMNLTENRMNRTPLHLAVDTGDEKMVRLLLKTRTKLNIQDKYAVTALQMALDEGHERIFYLLLKNGARVNIQNSHGLTPLCAMCLQDKTAIARDLLEVGAKVNIGENKGNLPLHFAARTGNTELCQLLIAAGATIDILNKHFESPLHLAVRMGHTEVVKLLIANGSDPNVCENYAHVTPLHVAVNTYSDVDLFDKILELLVEGDVCLDSCAFTSLETPLYRAMDQGKVTIAKCLLQHGANPNVDCPYDITILHKACQRNYQPIVEILLHSDLDWTRETWLETDVFSSGVNLKLLVGYEANIPMVLQDNLGLFFYIQDVRCSPMSLMRLCRKCIRDRLGNGICLKLRKMNLPWRLQEFIMLRII